MIELTVDRVYDGEYGKYTKVRSVTYDYFKKAVLDIHSDLYFAAISVVQRFGFFRFKSPLHVLPLDCDSTGEMLGAVNTLTTMKMKHVLIQSSPGRYWILVDRVADYEDQLAFARSIPGVHSEYLAHSHRKKRFSLRIVPLGGKKAIFQEDGVSDFTNAIVKQWYYEFKCIWELPEIQRRYHAEIIKGKIADESILSAAADPEFEL